MQQMYSCPSCGSPLEYGAQFCGNCGTPMNWPTQQQMQPPPPQPLTPTPAGYQQSPPGYQQPPPPPPGYQQPPQYQQQWNYQQMPPNQQQQYGYGWQPPRKQGSSNLIILFAVFACIFLLAGAYLIWSGGELPGSSGKSDDTTAAAQDETTPADEQEEDEEEDTTITDVNVEDMVADYQADAEAAKAKYYGKTITITGKVGGYDTSEFWVLLSDGEIEAVGAKCMFSESDLSKITDLNFGETVKVTGKISDFNIDITVNNCVFSL